MVVEGRREEADDDTKRVPAGVRERLWGRRNVSGAPCGFTSEPLLRRDNWRFPASLGTRVSSMTEWVLQEAQGQRGAGQKSESSHLVRK